MLCGQWPLNLEEPEQNVVKGHVDVIPGQPEIDMPRKALHTGSDIASKGVTLGFVAIFKLPFFKKLILAQTTLHKIMVSSKTEHSALFVNIFFKV